jgi:hypothetical protein
VLKLDTLLAVLNVAAGIAFFFRHFTDAELPFMIISILGETGRIRTHAATALQT